MAQNCETLACKKREEPDIYVQGEGRTCLGSPSSYDHVSPDQGSQPPSSFYILHSQVLARTPWQGSVTRVTLTLEPSIKTVLCSFQNVMCVLCVQSLTPHQGCPFLVTVVRQASGQPYLLVAFGITAEPSAHGVLVWPTSEPSVRSVLVLPCLATDMCICWLRAFLAPRTL